MTLKEQLEQTTSYLKNKGIGAVKAGVILGTGLNNLLAHIEISQIIPYYEIPHFPQATVEFHKGNLVYGQIGTTPVLVMQGRYHYYEGYSMQQITFPVYVMQSLGTKYLLLSNAAGGINPGCKKGDLVLIKDHINLLPENSLRGLRDPAYGTHFPDMSSPYDKTLCQKLGTKSRDMGFPLKSGVYAAVSGPNLETRAEYHYLRNIGADMVGMSTVPEVIVANQIGLPCAAISVITDECDPDNLNPVDIADIIVTAKKADKKLSKLFAEVVCQKN